MKATGSIGFGAMRARLPLAFLCFVWAMLALGQEAIDPEGGIGHEGAIEQEGMLEQEGALGQEAMNPAGARQALVQLHVERSLAAMKLGDLQAHIRELRKAHELAGGEDSRVVNWLASATWLAGDPDAARELREAILEKNLSPEQRFRHTIILAGYHATAGNPSKAMALTATVEPWLRLSNNDVSHAYFQWVHGRILSVQGRYADAVAALRIAVERIRAEQSRKGDKVTDPARFLRNQIEGALASNLIRQGKFAEAEWIQRDTIARSAKETGPDSAHTAKFAITLARTQLRQGRQPDALLRAESALAALERQGALPSSPNLNGALLYVGYAHTLGGQYGRAIAAFERRSANLNAGAGTMHARGAAGSVVWGYALIRSGRAAEALPMLKAHYELAQKRSPSGHTTHERAAMYAYALQRAGRTEEAASLFKNSVPPLFGSGRRARMEDRVDVLTERITNWILEGHMESLSSRASSGDIPAAAVMFRAADFARGSSVQRALALSVSRASIRDPELAELARKEQDLGNRVTALGHVVEELQARRPDKQPTQVIADMRRDLAVISTERAGVRNEIVKRFPEYAELTDPRAVNIAQLRSLLRPGEVLLATYTSHDRTYVWALPQAGKMRFSQSGLDQAQIAETVRKLRSALDVGAAALATFPAYDAALAYSLYEKLLKPLEDAWRDAKTLIVVPHGALGHLPFSVLPVAPAPQAVHSAGFEGYRKVEWLIKRVAVVQLPSVNALASLRATQRAAPAEEAFLGFGDPVFVRGQIPGAPGLRGALALRNLNVEASGDQARPRSLVDFKRLPPLPDTAQEIKEIAAILKAGDDNVLLGARASETNVKQRRLDKHRIVMFATHGLVPGDMDGLTQPALALSNPEITGEQDADGFLTMEEILGLQLNADWVVLSACNTASSGGAGSEAISGLGRAFFYAGARSLLVSNWPVETVSARLITTDLFRRQAGNATLSRAEALRRTMLNLMESGVALDSSGKPHYSYAHPMFWAPFMVVGDGG